LAVAVAVAVLPGMFALRPFCMILVALSYAALAAWDVLRRPSTGNAWVWLLAYYALGSGWAALDVTLSFGWLAGWPADLLSHLPLYAAFSQAILLLFLTREFLRARRPASPWYWFGALWLGAMLVLDSNVLRLAPALPAGPGLFIDRLALTQSGLILGWSAYIVNTVLWTNRVYRRTQQPLHRNRQAYWSMALALSVIAMAVSLTGAPVAGHIVSLAAGFVMALGLLTHQLLDVRQVLRQVVALMVVVGLAVIIYTAAFLAAPWLRQWFPGLPSLLAAVLPALVLVALANPALSWLRRQLEQWASGANYDAQQMVGKYGLTIGSIVDLDRLATVALDLIRDAIGIKRGVLFIVDPPASDLGETQFYGLRSAGVLGDGPQSGALLVESPIASHFNQEFGHYSIPTGVASLGRAGVNFRHAKTCSVSDHENHATNQARPGRVSTRPHRRHPADRGPAQTQDHQTDPELYAFTLSRVRTQRLSRPGLCAAIA